MATKKVPKRNNRAESLSNTMIEMLIDEFVHSELHRNVLKERLLNGMKYDDLAEKFGYSTRQIMRIVDKAEQTLFKHIEP